MMAEGCAHFGVIQVQAVHFAGCSESRGVMLLQLTAKEYGGGHDSPVGSDNEDDEAITRAPPPGFRGAGDVTMAKPDVVSS